MPDEAMNSRDLQPAGVADLDHALLDRVDAWGRGELHDLGVDHAIVGLPAPMLEDMRRVRLLRRTLIGAGIAVLAMLVLVLLVTARLLNSDGNTGEPAPSGLPAPAAGDELSFRAEPSVEPVQPSLRTLQRLNREPSVDQLVLPGPSGTAATPGVGPSERAAPPR